MFTKIIEFSVRNKMFVYITVGFLIIGGIYAMLTLPIDAVPDITNNQVQIVTQSPTLAPQEVERLITFPIEIAMSNILDVEEIRSVSRFGLSLVTVVFKDKVKVLDTRQLVNEQLQVVSGEISGELGTPELMPITTGLGEIYQYVLKAQKGFESRYSPMELRTIQDWIVKRQLSGIPGIVEINSFGGDVKQAEVAVDPAKMRALDVTISEVFEALHQNNQNTGGSYIEKNNHAYYIRSEGMIASNADIENIVITNRNGVPVLIRDIGRVGQGSATRFGAMTKDGEGECVGGIALMTRGANANAVTKAVRERVEMVQKILPDGLKIEPYLDRSELVNRNIGTVIRNLVEGAIIVLVVLMLFFGNFRAGAIVASIIPLAMFFAFIMMRLFNVSANLMSLGAIDFGIVIDGSIIIMEGILAYMYTHYAGKTLTRRVRDNVVITSGGDIARSATFAVLIILIVFFPILTLTGIEGKTFTPMAQTLVFAIVGALLLSLTYIPVMASTVLKRHINPKPNFSDRMMMKLKQYYASALKYALRYKYLALIIVSLLLAVSIFKFMRMGGEFMPQQDEGDFAMQMTLPPGSSLSESIELSTRAERILLTTFPDIRSVVSKIGTAEVPTDPMAVEDADVAIVMKPTTEWTSAKTRPEMVEKMKKALEVVTGASFTFSQPIQLRFNELMTGAKSDIAVKLYGEDMDELYEQATKAAALIAKVPGAADVAVERAIGLPQLVVKFDRAKIASYGLNIGELNTIIRSAYAGETAGVVYEGERRFDLVVRFDKNLVKDLDLNELFVRTPQGSQVPMSEVADVEFIQGPLQINRDATKRRIVIGVNVRDTDVQSVVEEIRELLDENMKLAPGYYFTYGGQFENLQNAQARLSIVIPIALGLIMFLLYFAFNSITYALLVFVTIPLAAIGGIWLLALRDISFSISAGIGFIALFGVAVLNGLLLINHYNAMRKKGQGLGRVLREGSKEILRPVLLTGLVASLGFIPMAFSNSAGSEMQRPLATVVIGGLLLSTLFTLFIVPILYQIKNAMAIRNERRKNKKNL